MKFLIPHTKKDAPLEGERGFTLLLAALLAAIALSLGASIYGLAQKELTLSSIGRDSQLAFYAADSAAECALYWDIRHNYFATSAPPVSPTCDGDAVSDSGRSPIFPYTITFQVEPNGYCADVLVEKSLDNSGESIRTTIRADGFSTSCGLIAGNPRTLQRSVELHY